MGTLWTPSGEHRPREEPPGATGAPAGPAPSGFEADAEAEFDISPEELAAVRALHAQLRATPAADVVANHVIQLFQLAVVYLGLGTPVDDEGTMPPPDLEEARLVIDAMGAIVEGLAGRFGPNEPTMREALSQIQLVYVQLAEQFGA